jgi:hypothetical protein
MPTQTARRPWQREELLLVFRFYCVTPFGRLYARNPDIIALARTIGRTPGSVAMKACNFASLDPAHQARGVRGLSGASAADVALWNEFAANSEALAAEAEAAAARLAPHPLTGAEPDIPDGPTEVLRTIRARRVQSFFRQTVLASYDFKCALTGLAIPELLNASHIIPWSDDETRRADPRNGICLSALYDRAFDRHLITLDEDLRVIVSPRLRREPVSDYQRDVIERVEGKPLRLPERFGPDPMALRQHRAASLPNWPEGPHSTFGSTFW